MQKSKQPAGKPTQSFLRMSEIKDGIVVLDDGTLRAIVNVSSTNFDLKSQEEQDSIIFNFQRFLNSLDFSVQILMQSRKMEVGHYIDKLKKMSAQQSNELLRVQTEEYTEFISRLIENASIMNKNFYIIVPLGESIFPPAGGIFSKFFGGGKVKEISKKIENFERVKERLNTRVLSLMSNLSSLGVQSQQLDSQGIIQLYYNSYNFEAGPLIDPAQLGDIKIAE